MYAPIWKTAALDELADAWVAADPATRDVIERIVNDLNRRPADDPTAVGESRAGNFRVALETPVAITSHVNPADAVVHVVHFWTY